MVAISSDRRERLDAHPPGQIARYIPEGLGIGLGMVARHGRLPAVPTFADMEAQRNLPQERNAHAIAGPVPAAVREDLRALAAVGAAEEAHVFDHAKDRNVELAEH